MIAVQKTPCAIFVSQKLRIIFFSDFSPYPAGFSYDFPTVPFTTIEPGDQGIGEFYVVQKRQSTDLKGSKIGICFFGLFGNPPISKPISGVKLGQAKTSTLDS